MSFESEPIRPQADEDAAFARAMAGEKVKLPAIFLIVVGALNLIASGYGMYHGATLKGQKGEINKAVEQAEKDLQKQTAFSKQQKEQQQQMVKTIEKYFNQAPAVIIIASLVGVFTAAVTILGGVQMMSLRSRGLAIFGAVLAAIPCLSTMGCCGLGEVAGIWSLIVLMSADVKSSFR